MNATKPSKVTLLTEEQIFPDDLRESQLDVFKDYGIGAGISDLAIIQGGFTSHGHQTKDGRPTGDIWTASSDGLNIRIVPADLDLISQPDTKSTGQSSNLAISCEPNALNIATRPVLPESVTKNIAKNITVEESAFETSGALVVHYGEYPQTVADDEATARLDALGEEALKKRETGKIYRFGNDTNSASDQQFEPKEYKEYEDCGKRYIRVKAKPYHKDSVLSNGGKLEKDKAYWVEVEPIEWLVDSTSGMMVAKQALFSGIPFDSKNEYRGDYASTVVSIFLNKFFAEDIVPSRASDIGNPSNLVVDVGDEQTLEKKETKNTR